MPPLFEAVHPDIQAFAASAALDTDEKGWTGASFGVLAEKKPRGGADSSRASYQAWSFADVHVFKPAHGVERHAPALVALTEAEPPDEREAIDHEGPARRQFLGLFKQMVRAAAPPARPPRARCPG